VQDDGTTRWVTEDANPASESPPGLMAQLRQQVTQYWDHRRELRHQRGLIATLNEVAEAVSAATSVREVLDAVVDRAKVVTDTDKAVLVLTDHHGDELDLDTLVVRGSRGQHSQDWWESRLDALRERAFETGRPVIERHPEEGAVILASPVKVRDHSVGLLGAINSGDRPFHREQIEYMSVLSAFAASAIENALLAEQSRYVLLASERDRIAGEMHDGVVQSLFSISLGLELCKKQVLRDPVAVAARLEELQQNLNLSMTELRRFIYDLRPMKLTELGLVGAVDYWIDQVTQGRPVRGRLVVDGEVPRLTPSEEACLYRVSKESVSNAVKHANARNIEVRIRFVDHRAFLSVTDDGDGFEAEQVMAGGTQGLGLASIRERVARENGSLEVISGETGTTVRAEVPIRGSV